MKWMNKEKSGTMGCKKKDIRRDALRIVNDAIEGVLPEEAVKKALATKDFPDEEKIFVVAIGKAAWNMAVATKEFLGSKISEGIVITKYDHSKGAIPGMRIIEAGHPVPDHNAVIGAEMVLKMVSGLSGKDRVILLISGGGSALFEKPMEGISLQDIMNITDQLLSSGANIIEINTVRKRLSALKGGKFAGLCGEAKIFSIVLSDVVGDHLDVIASGPAYPDHSTSNEALDIIRKYNLRVEDHIKKVIKIETPKIVRNCETVITGNVRVLCEAAANSAKERGYHPMILTSTLDCEAREAGKFMASVAREIKDLQNRAPFVSPPCAIIAGGETVVHLRGKGKGGRNQELALAAAIGIDGISDVVLFSLGSDGTDGPTDAAGGMVDGKTVERMRSMNILPQGYLGNNDSYHALKASGDLIFTGSTGTNVNDLVVLLCK